MPVPKRRKMGPGREAHPVLPPSPSAGVAVGQVAPPSLHYVKFALFFPGLTAAENFGSGLYPAQAANAGADEHLIKHNEGGRCGAISNLGAMSFQDGVIAFGESHFLTNANMNASQPGIVTPIFGQDPPIEVAIRWQSTYRLTPALRFKQSSQGPRRTLRSTWVVPALAYSPLVRRNLTELLVANNQHPEDSLDEAFAEPFVFEYAVHPDHPGQFISASPDDWHHLIWLEPSLTLNHLFFPLVDNAGSCWLEIRSDADLRKLKVILDYFEIEHRLVELESSDEEPVDPPAAEA